MTTTYFVRPNGCEQHIVPASAAYYMHSNPFMKGIGTCASQGYNYMYQKLGPNLTMWAN